MYEYIWQRVGERRKEKGFEDLHRETMAQLAKMKDVPLEDVSGAPPMDLKI